MLERARSTGFTLIEFLVTFTILGLLMMLAVPGITDWLHSTQIRSVAEAMESGLQRARNEALMRNKTVTFWMVTSTAGSLDATCSLVPGSASWVVSIANPAGKCDIKPNSGGDPYVIESLASRWSGLTISAVAFDGRTAANSVGFMADGTAVSSAGFPIAFINVSYAQPGSRALQLQVSPTGSVRVCDPALAGQDPRSC